MRSVGYFGALGRWEMFETAGGLLGETLGGNSFFPCNASKGKFWG